MDQKTIHVYLMPGMAANPTIFEYIKLPEPRFKIHWLKWFMPLLKEPIEDYALRMTQKIKHENPVLIGVSLGGILVQEMSKHIKLRQLVIVSSIKANTELPRKMRIARMTKIYKLLPTGLVSNIEFFEKYAFGETVIKRLKLYKKYLSVNDKRYLDWGIEEIINWKQESPIEGIIHIHGEKDNVFPIKNISKCISIKGGTHVMIINKFKWFNENLPQLLVP